MRRFTCCLVLAFVAVGLSCSRDGSGEPSAEDRAVVRATDATNVMDGIKPNEKAPTVSAKPANAEKPNGVPKLLPHALIETGWISLFDGRSLFGWKPSGKAKWTVTDGVVIADGSSPGFLMTTFQLADYEFQCEFRLQATSNSGIFLRTTFDPKDPSTDCYELNLCDSHPEFPTGSIVARHRADAEVSAEGDWKKLQIRIEGPHIVAKLDDRQTVDFSDAAKNPRENGHIGLQTNGGRIEFREIRLRPLGTWPLFLGDSLTGWREVPGSKSKFTVVDGAIHVTNGRGFLETERTFKDFVLQADFRTNGDQLNSGIFFRAQPGTAEAPSNGYEFQIHNGFKDGDRSQPVDHGTGAIFRRTKARWVVSDDRRWTTGTLIANGPHFATWVDGYQVVDWTDERQPHENPREGKRLEAGHISLQGHDPTTDLDFRNIKFAEIPNEQ